MLVVVLAFFSLAVEMESYRNYKGSLLLWRHLVLSEMPKHILYGFHLFLPKGYVAFKTSVVFVRLTRPLWYPRDLKWHYKSLFKECGPLYLCAARCSSCSSSHLSFCSSVLLLSGDFAVNSSRHYIFPAFFEVSVEQAHPEEWINTSR